MAESLESMIGRGAVPKPAFTPQAILEKKQKEQFKLSAITTDGKEFVEAEYALGRKYSEGDHLEQDKKQAVECYRRVAEQEYKNSRDVPKNEGLALNYKNTLLEIAQSYFGVERPQYIHFDYGPHHAKVFRCICSFHKQMASGIGRTKIEAEQRASQAMLNKIRHLCFKQIDSEWILSTTEELTPLSSKILDILDNLKHDSHFDVLSLYGNAVLRYVIAQYLYDNYSEFREGVLTLIIAETMREETCARVARNLKLETYIRSEVTTRTLTRTLSAVIGKLNLLELESVAKELILEHYQPFIDHSVWIVLSNVVTTGERTATGQIKTTIHNFKNELQEHAQKYGLPMPSYHLIGKEGVDHAPTFTVKCVFKKMAKIGKGTTVKSAEQNAAKNILENILLDADKERSVTRSHTYAISPVSDFTPDARYIIELRRHLDLPNFVTLEHLTLAFTHPSLNDKENYQRLEFLGDAILRMLIINYLLLQYPKIIDKGFLSSLVDQLVSAETQTKIATKLQLNKCVLTSAPVTDRTLSNVLEALIAAIYISVEASPEVNFGNSAMPIIINWFKPEIMKSLGKYHLATDGTIGSDNFPALPRAAVAKTTASTDKEVCSYAAVATTKQVTKTQSIFWSAPKIQKDFPPLNASAAKAKLTVGSLEPTTVTTTTQPQISTRVISTATKTKIRSYAEATRQVPIKR